MTNYYHCAPLPLGSGSIICPGNWGRVKRKFEENGVTLIRELGLEAERAKNFSDKPSRLDAAFVCTSMNDITKYREAHAKSGIIYEVELVDPNSPQHVGDFMICVEAFSGLNGIEHVAQRYWTGVSLGNPEILTLSPLRILKCVDPDAPNLPGLR